MRILSVDKKLNYLCLCDIRINYNNTVINFVTRFLRLADNRRLKRQIDVHYGNVTGSSLFIHGGPRNRRACMTGVINSDEARDVPMSEQKRSVWRSVVSWLPLWYVCMYVCDEGDHDVAG